MTVQMVDIDDLMPSLMRYTPNLPEPTAYAFIRQACREFCRRTKVWRHNTEFSILTLSDEVVVTIPESEIIYIDEARLGETDLEPIPLETLDDDRPGWYHEQTLDADGNETEGVAQYITQLTPNTITVYPRQTGTVKARYILMPSLDAELVPEFFLTQYREVIGRGAAAEAFAMPDAEFFNPTLAAAHSQQFEMGMRRQTSIVSKGQQRGRNRTKASYF